MEIILNIFSYGASVCESAFMIFIMLIMFPRKNADISKAKRYALNILVTAIVFVLGNTLAFPLNNLSWVIFVTLYGIAFHKGKAYQIFFTPVLSLLYMLLIDIIFMLLILPFIHKSGLGLEASLEANPGYRSIATFLSKAMLLASAFALNEKKKRENLKFTFPKYIYPIGLICILAGTMFVGFLTYFDNSNSQNNEAIVLMLMMTVVLFFIICVVCIRIDRKKEQEIHDRLNFRRLVALQQMREEVADFENVTEERLGELLTLINTGDYEKLDKQLSAYTKEYESSKLFQTGNKVYDTILSRYNYLCADVGVRFDCNVQTGSQGDLRDSDAVNLLSNLLSNALEAAIKTTTGNKLLNIVISKRQNTLVIKIRNSYDTILMNKNGEFRTTKDEYDSSAQENAGKYADIFEQYEGSDNTTLVTKKMHGIGSKSIDAIVKKYDGYISYQPDESTRIMNVNLAIPINE